ncbi:MAG: hypothetical protein AAB354_04060 [candidate division KSB1 bacterium]
MDSERDEHGRFRKGEYPGGPGRPRKAPEPSRQQIFTEIITPEKFRAVVQQVWLDAIGKKIDDAGKLVDDKRSTPLARSSAFARLAAYMLGKPIQPLLVDNGEGNVLDLFRSMSDAQLDQIIAEAQRALNNNGAKNDAEETAMQ